MRIAILYNNDIYSNEALNHLLPSLVDHDVGLFFSQRVGPIKDRDHRLLRLGFMEQTLFTDLLFPLMEEHGLLAERFTFRQLAERFCEVIRPLTNINSPEESALLAAFAPDLIISIRFGQILRRGVLKLPTVGTLNLHSGLLPAYKGVMASFWSLLHRADHLGMTLHWIDSESIDDGPIIATTRQPVSVTRSYFRQTLSLYPDGVAILVAAINEIVGGSMPESQPGTGRGAYFSFPDAKALDRFESAAGVLVAESDMLPLMEGLLIQQLPVNPANLQRPI